MRKMSKIPAVLFAVFMFASCGGSGGGGVGETGMFPAATPQCARSGESFLFPGGTACPEGPGISSGQLLTTKRGEYFENCGIDGESRSYVFADETGGDEGTGRDEIVRGSIALGGGEIAEFTGKRLNFRWMFDAETCSLRVTYDRSLCGITFEYRVAGVSNDSITLETANPNAPGEVVSTTCMRKQAVSSE